MCLEDLCKGMFDGKLEGGIIRLGMFVFILLFILLVLFVFSVLSFVLMVLLFIFLVSLEEEGTDKFVEDEVILEGVDRGNGEVCLEDRLAIFCEMVGEGIWTDKMGRGM